MKRGRTALADPLGRLPNILRSILRLSTRTQLGWTCPPSFRRLLALTERMHTSPWPESEGDRGIRCGRSCIHAPKRSPQIILTKDNPREVVRRVMHDKAMTAVDVVRTKSGMWECLAVEMSCPTCHATPRHCRCGDRVYFGYSKVSRSSRGPSCAW